jgi:signal transduction histidine kinase
MYDESVLSASATQRTPRSVAYSFLDTRLCFATEDIDIKSWLDLGGNSLIGTPVTRVFPELVGHEDRIQQLVFNPADCFIQPGVHRRSKDKLDHYYDLQISAAKSGDNTLLLIVIDVTQPTLINNRFQEIKSIPALKVTPEEIRRNLEALERWNQALFLLNQAGQVLTATLEKKQVLEQLLQVAIELIGAEGSSVWLFDDAEPEYLVCQAAYHKGLTPSIVEQRLHLGQGLAGWVAETGKSTAVISADDDPRFSPDIDAQSGFTTISLLVVPLRLRNRIIGVLEVVNKLEGDFDTDDLAVAETLASSASIAIDNARLVETLQRQTEDLRARNEELDAFAHTVAHDLQNPLAQIVGYAEVLRLQDVGLDRRERDKGLKVIANSAHKMSSIIRELLLLSSVRKAEVEMRPLKMQAIVDAALARLSHLVEEYKAEVHFPAEWPTAVGHAPWIEEIWENYLSNAMKYGGTPPRVELGGAVQADGMVQFWVRDNGPGLTPEEQSHLFSPFTKLGGNGYGLGLSIVWRIANKLGGNVAVTSAVGKGSVFSFTLPGFERKSWD